MTTSKTYTKRIVVIIFIVFLGLYLFSSREILKFAPSISKITLKNIPRCYDFPVDFTTSNGLFFDEFLTAKIKPDPGVSIFFLVTTCFKDSKINLLARQACAIESAAFHHPNRKIFVLFISPVQIPPESQSPVVDALQEYKNIHILNLNIKTLVYDTRVTNIFESGVMFDSKYLVHHISDVLRLIILYKYGGIYFDLDVVVRKNLDKFPQNFLGLQTWDGSSHSIGNGVLGFQDQTGRDILDLCLKDISENFDPNSWSQNGGAVFERVMEKQVCHTTKLEMTPEKCRGLKMFGPNEFYPAFDQADKFFKTEFTEEILDKIRDSSVPHLFHNMTKYMTIKKSTSKTGYEILAEENCPKSYGASGEYF